MRYFYEYKYKKGNRVVGGQFEKIEEFLEEQTKEMLKEN